MLWTRWGRIGQVGQYQKTPFNTEEEAEKEFCKVFRQKTGTQWKDIETYDPVYKKYQVKTIEGKTIVSLQGKEDKSKVLQFSNRNIDFKSLLKDFKEGKTSCDLENNLELLIRLMVNTKVFQSGSDYSNVTFYTYSFIFIFLILILLF